MLDIGIMFRIGILRAIMSHIGIMCDIIAPFFGCDRRYNTVCTKQAAKGNKKTMTCQPQGFSRDFIVKSVIAIYRIAYQTEESQAIWTGF